jgi:hypothetical protein
MDLHWMKSYMRLVPCFYRLASVLDEAKYFRLDKYLFDPSKLDAPHMYLWYFEHI